MKNFKTYLVKTLLALLIVVGVSTSTLAGTPQIRKNGVTVIHLDEYNGYFSAQETVANLKAGKYEFVVSNKANKRVGFQIQDLGSKTTLDMFPLEPGETRISQINIGADGVRYRCPINPTPWYDLDVIK